MKWIGIQTKINGIQKDFKNRKRIERLEVKTICLDHSDPFDVIRLKSCCFPRAKRLKHCCDMMNFITTSSIIKLSVIDNVVILIPHRELKLLQIKTRNKK